MYFSFSKIFCAKYTDAGSYMESYKIGHLRRVPLIFSVFFSLFLLHDNEKLTSVSSQQFSGSPILTMMASQNKKRGVSIDRRPGISGPREEEHGWEEEDSEQVSEDSSSEAESTSDEGSAPESRRAEATLADRLRELEEEDAVIASGIERRKQKRNRKADEDADEPNKSKKPKKTHKNAPAELSSRRPVSRQDVSRCSFNVY
jgi:hypothetical protein